MDTKRKFTLKIVNNLLQEGFSVFLHNKEHLDGYGGWLEADGEDRELAVAVKHHMGFEILLHEYCHFLQYKNDRSFWDKSSEKYDLLFDWATGEVKEAEEDALNESLEMIIRIEHDCERRALKIVELNPIEDFDTVKYKKAVNAYLWSYHIMREVRQRPKRPIYTERVLEHMPDSFDPDVGFYLDPNNLKDQLKKALMVEFEE